MTPVGAVYARPMTRLRLLLLGCAIIVGGWLAEGPALAAPPAPNPASLAGRYDGHQIEIAAALELGPDGRFHYALSYGALDEEARGKWEFDGTGVLLTSDPVVAPKFVLLTARPLQAKRLKLTLDLPRGMDRQYFKARVRLSDGRSIERQFAADGLDTPLGAGERVVSVALLLPVYGLEGEPARLPRARGGEAHFRFDANDLGKVAFERRRLPVEQGGLLLERHGRTILFRRSAAP
jgi:hypothetical protein